MRTSDLAGKQWRRSSRCSESGCVEVMHLGDQVLVRDSKEPDERLLTFDRGEWTAFIAGVRDGEFDA